MESWQGQAWWGGWGGADSEKTQWLSGFKLVGRATGVFVCVAVETVMCSCLRVVGGDQRWSDSAPACVCVFVCVRGGGGSCVSVAHTTVAGLRSISSSNFTICCMSLALQEMKTQLDRRRRTPSPLTEHGAGSTSAGPHEAAPASPSPLRPDKPHAL